MKGMSKGSKSSGPIKPLMRNTVGKSKVSGRPTGRGSASRGGKY